MKMISKWLVTAWEVNEKLEDKIDASSRGRSCRRGVPAWGCCGL